jgi:hypothetical protein
MSQARRAEFLNDIITTALEGGIGYWSQASQYQWIDDYDGRVHVVVGDEIPGGNATAIVHRLNDDESDYVEEGLLIDQACVRRGLRRILDGDAPVGERYREGIRDANRANDASLIDADDADVIVQAGLFGEVVYG